MRLYFSGLLDAFDEYQDLLVAIFLRIEDPELLCKLSMVSRSVRTVAESDQVWSAAITNIVGGSMFENLLKCMRGDAGSPQTSQIYGLLCGDTSVDANPAGQDWHGSNRRAFIRLISALAREFVQNPDSVCELLTVEAEDEEQAGIIVASFIFWLSPKRRGLPDIRTQAIKASNPAPCPSLPLRSPQRLPD